MKPDQYLSYLKTQNWLSIDRLSPNLLMSYMPMGLDPEIWDQGQSENFFLGRVRHLPGNIELLSSFGIGGPAARMHLALAIELGVQEVICVGTVGSHRPDQLKIGDIVQFEKSHLDLDLPSVSFSTVFDLWEMPTKDSDVVEMEAEYLFAWCQDRSVKLTYIGVVSDIVQDGAWEPGFHQIKDSLGKAHRLAYEALVKKGQ